MAYATASSQQDTRAAHKTFHPYRILVVLTEPMQERYLREYAGVLARRQLADVGVLRDYDFRGRPQVESHPALPHSSYGPVLSEAACDGTTDLASRIAELAESWPFGMIVADWPDEDDDIATYARLVRDIDVTAVLIRHRACSLRRVLIPAGGGAHALEGIRVANALAEAWSLDAKVLRVVKSREGVWLRAADLKHRCRHVRNATRLYLDVADVRMPIKVSVGSDVAEEILRRSRASDLIVVGGSSQWLMENHASSAIPSRVASRAAGPVMMVLTNRGRPSALTDVFYDRTVLVGLHASDKQHAITVLVDALVEGRQVPVARRKEILTEVMARERAGTTYVGHGTAIPHAAIPGFRGLTGVLGVFPEGVPFGEDEDQRATFVYLLLTPKESYEVYLPILARIARCMSDGAKRRRLIESVTPHEAVGVFAEAEREWRAEEY